MTVVSANIGPSIADCTPMQIVELENRMRPGKYSAAGFLGENESLVTVYQNDLQTLKDRGVSCEEIGDTLASLIQKATRFTHNSSADLISVGKFMIAGANTRTIGHQSCPFGDEMGSCGKGRGDFEITNTQNELTLKCSELAIHLIQAHHFFEGHTAYRVDPVRACSVLELAASHYQRDTEPTWEFVSCQTLEETEAEIGDFEVYESHARQRIPLSDTATAYIVPCAEVEKLKDMEACCPRKVCKIEGTESVVELYCHVVCTQENECGRDERGYSCIINQQELDHEIAGRRLKASLSNGVFVYKMGEIAKISSSDDEKEE